jgi:polyisoprenoid-binding protein YceI
LRLSESSSSAEIGFGSRQITQVAGGLEERNRLLFQSGPKLKLGGWKKMLERIAGVVLVIFVGVTSATPVVAQNTVWRIDPEHSTARLFLASSKSPQVNVNVGVARMSGIVGDIGGDPSESVFDFTIYPADETAPTSSNGKGSEQNAPLAEAHTVITFKSEHVVPIGGGAFRVTGELAVTYIERSATYDPTAAYAGPVYGPPVVHSETKEVVFEFERMGVSAARVPERGTAELSGSTVVGAHDYPELFTAVSAMDWPAFVEDEQCTWPSTVGRYFLGPVCTGETVEPLPRNDIHCKMPSTVGRDFAGEVCTGTPLQTAQSDAVLNRWEKQQHRAGTPDEIIANEVVIQLDLRLTQTDSALSGSADQ